MDEQYAQCHAEYFLGNQTGFSQIFKKRIDSDKSIITIIINIALGISQKTNCPCRAAEIPPDFAEPRNEGAGSVFQVYYFLEAPLLSGIAKSEPIRLSRKWETAENAAYADNEYKSRIR